MGTVSGFVILAEKESEVTDKIYDLLKERHEKDLYVFKEGVDPNKWFVKNSHFSRNGKNKLKLFVEVSHNSTYFHKIGADGKKRLTPYDFKTFDEINKIINENNPDDFYLLTFRVDFGIRKTKPDLILNSWKGKLI